MGRLTRRGGSEAGPELGYDLRTPLLGLAAWSAALVVSGIDGWRLGGLTVLLVVVGGIGCRWRGRWPVARFAAVLVLVAFAVGSITFLRETSTTVGPVPAFAKAGAVATVRVQITDDPVVRSGTFADYVMVHGTVTRVQARGERWRVASPVLVIAPRSWSRVPLGGTILARGRFATAQGDDLAGVFRARGSPDLVAGPGWPLRVAERVRVGVRQSVEGQAREPRTLVPALVDGDDAGLPETVQEDFRDTGLTHLLAVSGTNLTIVVGALLILARSAGVRGRALIAVGALGVVAFVLLARPQPSVLRAAVMGSVALIGMGADGKQRGPRAWGIAVLLLMLFQPGLAGDIGFALSALATAGILFLAPRWRDGIQTWLPSWAPRWIGEAIAVPAAAQLACTPVVAAISGSVSLVAVMANLVAEPMVAPATVLGVVGGCLSALWEPLGRPCGWAAAWAARWLIEVAERFAELPSAAIAWPATPLAITLLTLVCAWSAAALSRIFRHRAASLITAVSSVLLVCSPLPAPGWSARGWPPAGWAMVMCDVGQGDGLVLRAGDRAGIVVDTGPDPRAMDACLRRLRIDDVPLVVLTHFHADHIDGLSGVIDGRRVGAISVTDLADPISGSRQVRAMAAAARIPVRVARPGEEGRAGLVRWRVLAPSGPSPAGSASPANDASIVWYADIQGLRVLLMGDEETGSQQRLASVLAGTTVDVVKVAHHGSAKQDPALIEGLQARLALISVGAGNDYGHPAARTLRLLEQAGLAVRRTDLSGDIAVLVHGDRLGVTSRGSPGGEAGR